MRRSAANASQQLDLSGESRRFGCSGNQSADGHVNAHAFSAFAVGFFPLPVPFMDIFWQSGSGAVDPHGPDDSSLFALDERGTDFAWGGGAQAHFGPLGLRLEYGQFHVRNTTE